MQCTGCATSAVCSFAAVVAEPTPVSPNVDAVPMLRLQCDPRWMQHVMTDDAVPMKVDAVSTAVVAVPPTLSWNVVVGVMQWVQCPNGGCCMS